MQEWVTGGLAFVESVQTLQSPILDFYFLFMTFLGNEEFFLIALPAIYWCVDKRIGRRLLFLLVFSNVLNGILKNTFRLPRPPEIIHRIEEVGYGLPSGHAMNAVSLWGYAAWRFQRLNRWIWLAVILVVASTAFSRIYLGVHYPADTVTGLLFGVLTLLLYLWIEARLLNWIPRADRRMLVGGALLLPLLLIFIHPGDAHQYPAENALTLAGLLLGATFGVIYETDHVRFSSGGTLQKRALRYALGLALTVVVWLGLSMIFDLVDGPLWLDNVLRVVRYALTGIAVAGIAPAIFVRLKLAEQVASA